MWNWNSLIFSAITLIVSVTAPRRVPRTGRMFLLIPLDSPLSPVSFGFIERGLLLPDLHRFSFLSRIFPAVLFYFLLSAFSSYVHGNRPAAVLRVMNTFRFVTLTTFRNSISSQILKCVSSWRAIVRFYSCMPEPFSAGFDMISVLCSGPLLPHHTHQYAHRPFFLDAHYFGRLQVSY